MQVKQAFCLTGALNLFHFPLRLTPVMRFFFFSFLLIVRQNLVEQGYIRNSISIFSDKQNSGLLLSVDLSIQGCKQD